MNSMLRKASLAALVLSAFCAVGLHAQQFDPSQIKFPTGAPGCVYAPGSNTCVSPGAVPLNGSVETGDYTVTTASFVQMNCAVPCTVTLPAAVATGFSVAIERTGAGTVTINPNGVTYDGATSIPLQNEFVAVWTDGTGYHSSSPWAIDASLNYSLVGGVATLGVTAGASGAICTASGSGTAQSCTIAGFTLSAPKCFTFTTATTNTGTAFALTVNGTAASAAKWLGTTTLAAGDIPANKAETVCYDGTNFNLMTVGNAPSGASLPSTTNVIKGDGSGGGLAATPGTDYVVPGGNVATATALATDGSNCTGTDFAKGVDASGNAQGCATPAGGSASGQLAQATPAGTTMYDSATSSGWSSLADFTVTGTTPTVTNGTITFNPGSTNSFDAQALSLITGVSADDEVDAILSFQIIATASGSGVGIGRKAIAGTAWDISLVYNPASGAITFYQNASGTSGYTTLKTWTTVHTAANDDQMILTYSQRQFALTATVSDVTGGWTEQYTFEIDAVGSIPGTGNWKLFGMGGNQGIERFHLVSYQPYGAYLMIMGDSKMDGGIPETRVVNMLANLGSVGNLAGPGDQSLEAQDAVPYVCALKPQNVLLNIGRNDIISGTFTGSTQYQAAVTALQACGITVVHMLPIPEPTLSQTSLSGFINSTYPSACKVDPSTGWVNATDVGPDNIHPNFAGHLLLAQDIYASGCFTPQPHKISAASAPLPATVGSTDRFTATLPITFDGKNIACPGCSTSGPGSYIAQVVTSGHQAAIAFSSIPQTPYYTLHLECVGQSHTSAFSDSVNAVINSDAAAHYAFAGLTFGAAGPSNNNVTGYTAARLGRIAGLTAGSNTFTPLISEFPLYASTLSSIKTWVSYYVSANAAPISASQIPISDDFRGWYIPASPAGITSLVLSLTSTDYFMDGTVCTLF